MKMSVHEGATRQLTVRLPSALYSRAREMARARRTSVNALLRRLLEEADELEREQELTRAYELLGEDAASGVEPFFAAQSEVARRG